MNDSPFAFIKNAFQKVSSALNPPSPGYIEPFRPPIPETFTINPESRDSILTNHLDLQLYNYMHYIHQCNTCESCWPIHKKTAIKLLKLHPDLYKNLNETPSDKEDE